MIHLDGYKGFGFNRSNLHKRAVRGSGGVGFFVNNIVCDLYVIDYVDKNVDGIIGIRFTCKRTDIVFVMFSCYLPPHNSARGRDESHFFNTFYHKYTFSVMQMC